MASTETEKSGKAKRTDELEESIRSKSRGGLLSQVPAEQLMLIIGGIFMPLGLLAVVLGWYGTAQTPFLFEQIPYLASGGFAGVALVLTGGFLYFGSWLARMVVEARKQNAALLEALHSIEDRIDQTRWAGSVGVDDKAVAGAAAGAAAAMTSELAAANGYLVATPKGSMVHVPSCAVVANREGLRKVAAESVEEDGFVPCKICAPLG